MKYWPTLVVIKLTDFFLAILECFEFREHTLSMQKEGPEGFTNFSKKIS